MRYQESLWHRSDAVVYTDGVVYRHDGKRLGEMLFAVDGSRLWKQDPTVHISSNDLREVADLLDFLNKDWDNVDSDPATRHDPGDW